jgi:hypothetical protein
MMERLWSVSSVESSSDIIKRSSADHKKGVNPELDGDVVKNQAVIELTMQDWEDAIEMFDIRRSSIPNRARPTEAPGASGWYSGTAT